MTSSPVKNVRSIQARKQDFVRNEIWHAAIDLFAKKGFEETTIDQIADASKVSRRTFFRYFSSKEDLLVQAVSNYQEIITEAIREFSHIHAPLEMLKKIVSRVAEHVITAPHVRKAMQITRDSASARGAQLARLYEIEILLAAEFSPSCRRYSRSEYTPRLMAALTLSTLSIAFQVWLERNSEGIGPIVDQVFASFGRIYQHGMS
jgi:AcrR family transcriptional regulator